AMPMIASVLAAVPAGLPLPSSSGTLSLGGAIGRLLAVAGLSAGRDLIGPVGALLVWLAGLALAASLTLLALGLTSGEWRSAGTLLYRGARGGVSGSRRLVHFMGSARTVPGIEPRLGRLLPLRRGRPDRREPSAIDRLAPMNDPAGYPASTTAAP